MSFFEKILLKISIIWTCDCTCVASDDAYASVICFWWCMLLMHESIVGKETETTDFFWRVLLSNYLVFDCCWFWVGCHVGRIKARARFWSISLWMKSQNGCRHLVLLLVKCLLEAITWVSCFNWLLGKNVWILTRISLHWDVFEIRSCKW